MNKATVKLALRKFYHYNNLRTPEAVMTNLGPAFKYLLKLRLVKAEWYVAYEQAAHQQYAIYISRR